MTTTSKVLAVIAVGTLLVAGCTPADTESAATTQEGTGADSTCRNEPTGPTTYQYAQRPGTEPDRTSVDVYLPAGCGPAPAVLWVHGGGWRRGDKAGGFVERKAAWAASFGAALVSVNYRLTTPDSGVQWPDHGDDMAAAVAWVQNEGASAGLDVSRLSLLGHSAGAHLVAIVGTDPSLLISAGADPSGIACVVALDFSFDLANAPAEDLIANAFGTDPQVIADASPNVQVERNGRPTASFLVVTRGGAGRVADAQTFVDLINDSGGSAQLLDANPYGHDDVSVQLGASGEQVVTTEITGFLQSCLAATATPAPAA